MSFEPVWNPTGWPDVLCCCSIAAPPKLGEKSHTGEEVVASLRGWLAEGTEGVLDGYHQDFRPAVIPLGETREEIGTSWLTERASETTSWVARPGDAISHC